MHFHRTQVKAGTFTHSGGNTETITINCGFKPKFIAIFLPKGYETTPPTSRHVLSSGGNVCIYNEEYSSGHQIFGWRDSGANFGLYASPIPYTTSMLQEITSTGFSFMVSSNAAYAGTYYYFAVG